MEENWKDIKGYEGLYQVSDFGNVRSLDRDVLYSNGRIRTHKGRIITSRIGNSGYSLVILSKNGKTKGVLVHRLVCIAFNPNPENKPQVNHKDGVKHHNWKENLEWSTRSENMIHAHRTGLKKTTKAWTGKFGRDHCKSKSVNQLAMNGDFIAKYGSMAEAERETGVHKSHICQVCKGKLSSIRGFKWEYA